MKEKCEWTPAPAVLNAPWRRKQGRCGKELRCTIFLTMIRRGWKSSEAEDCTDPEGNESEMGADSRGLDRRHGRSREQVAMAASRHVPTLDKY